MNIQNIVTLSEQLKVLGFIDIATVLLKRICFKPADLIITKKIQKDNQQVSFELYFEKDKEDGSYFLKFYDAILQYEMSLSTGEANGVEIKLLESKMNKIDWKEAFDFDVQKQWAAENRSSWQAEASISEVMDDFNKLEQTDEGKSIAAMLKNKYWSAIPMASNFTNLSYGRNKQDIVQRFYFSGGQSGISVDEAFRFLQNRLLEKQMRQKAKQAEEASGDDSSTTSNGSGLLRKRRIAEKSKKLKTEGK
jgi:hypothetical protein